MQFKNPFRTAKSPVLGPEDGRGAGCEGDLKLYLLKVISRSEDASAPLSTLQATISFCQGPQSFYEGVIDSLFLGHSGPRGIEIPPSVKSVPGKLMLKIRDS